MLYIYFQIGSAEMKSFYRAILGTMVLGGILNSCSDNSEVGTIGRAQVAVFNLVPQQDSFNFYLDTNKITSVLSFGEVHPYDTLAAGRRTAKVHSVVKDSVTLSKDLYLNPYRDYSFFIVPADSTNTGLAYVATVDYLSEPNIKTNAKVRFIHLSPEEHGVDLYTRLGDAEEKKTFSNAFYQSASPFQEIKAGTYSLKLTPANVTDQVILTENVSLEAKKVYTIFISGLKDSSSDYSQRITIVNNR